MKRKLLLLWALIVCLSTGNWGVLSEETGDDGMCRDDGSCMGDGLALTCIDLPGKRSGKEWFDGTNGCKEFEQADKDGLMFCSKFGSGDFGEGSAKDQCCTCGGGARPKAQPVHFQDDSEIPPICPNPIPNIPNIAFAGYREKPWFHQINLAFPGVQLVHERPYVFVVDAFINEADCALLIEKAEENLKADESNQCSIEGGKLQGARTSKRPMTRNEEVMPLRHKIASLANLDES